jgi:hypothetical protein
MGIIRSRARGNVLWWVQKECDVQVRTKSLIECWLVALRLNSEANETPEASGVKPTTQQSVISRRPKGDAAITMALPLPAKCQAERSVCVLPPITAFFIHSSVGRGAAGGLMVFLGHYPQPRPGVKIKTLKSPLFCASQRGRLLISHDHRMDV